MGNLDDYKNSSNIAELLDDNKLTEISNDVIHGYTLDKESRHEWELLMEKALKLAKQIFEPKSAGMLSKAANVKFPLLTQASVQFASRAYSEIIKGNKVVYTKIIGPDLEKKKILQAKKVMTYMEYQLFEGMPDWECGVDRLLSMLPIFGTVFKKTYYDPIHKRMRSDVIEPVNIVIHNDSKSLDQARRVTHILHMTENDIIERIRGGLYSDIDLDELDNSMSEIDDSVLVQNQDDSDMDEDEKSPYMILEQHCWLDLDDDGYEEPYIVTLERNSGKILRIVNRFDKIEKRKGEVKYITAEQYFIDYHFIRSPDGGFYSVGLGSLLVPINESINTIINQLIDAGSLANRQGGFIGGGLRIKGGSMLVKSGEWKILDTAFGSDIKNNIVPLPIKEPSPTLFNLLQLLIGVGNDIASINDVLQGKEKAQNVPATTMLALIEQGTKVLGAIHKRLYISQKKEFKRLFELNRKFLDYEEYSRVVEDPFAVASVDFDNSQIDIVPIADPVASSEAHRLTKARALIDFAAQIPVLDPRALGTVFLESLEMDTATIDFLMPEPDPNAPPPPEVLKDMAMVDKLKAETQALMTKPQLEQVQLMLKQQAQESEDAERLARIDKMRADAALGLEKVRNVDEKLRDNRINSMQAAMQKDAGLALELERIRADIDKELIKLRGKVNNDKGDN